VSLRYLGRECFALRRSTRLICLSKNTFINTGLDELETLNIGLVTDLTKDDFDTMLIMILPIFHSLKKLRIFGSVPMDIQIRHQDIDIDFCTFDEFTDFD
jgi:hypothetical protein